MGAGNIDEQAHGTGLEIAVIGMACRFPGAADTRSFWHNLKEGVESITFFSIEELEEAGVDREELRNPGYVRAKGILEDIEFFDAVFFGLSPNEAVVMDPQMRIFHECAWTALEDAGVNPDTYGGLIGIYSGAAANLGWEALAVLSGRARVLGEFHSWHLYDKDFLPTQVSYHLNLRGPAISVQTACSTSLVAVHLACQALLSGECDMALAGGVSVRVPSKEGYLYQEGLIVSPDGHCRAFDANGGGTVLGEGCGIVVLKQLVYAREDNDNIYAVIKGSAVNNDGRVRVGYTSPGVLGQVEVIRAAHQAADVDPETIGYIEAHGTATRLGDTTEIEALTRAFNSKKRQFCAIGSVKTNIGHLDCAAGIAGLIKTVLAIYYRLIPASLHFESPHREINFLESPFYVNRRLSSWPDQRYPLRAGVSSFGIGGTNVHLIIEEVEVAVEVRGDVKIREWQLLVLSALTATGLDRVTRNLGIFLQDQGMTGPGEKELGDIAYTLQTGRKAFPYRCATLCSSWKQAVGVFSASNPEAAGTRSLYSSYCPGPHQPLVFMFPGQGSQYVNMGKDLYMKEGIFREKVDRCFDLLEACTGLCGDMLRGILYPGSGVGGVSDRINQTGIAQPLLFIFEYALARMLMSWGIEPGVMLGHSLGEFTAACIAGVLSLEDALTLVERRGYLMQQLPPGVMISVDLSPERVLAYMNDHISLSAVNTPDRCVLSGPIGAMAIIERRLKQDGIQVRSLHTSHAFHSSMMEPIVDDFYAVVSRVHLEKPRIPFISSVTGTWIREGEATDPFYWATQMKRPVQLANGIGGLLMTGNPVLVEVGPGRTLCSLTRQNLHFQSHHGVVDLVRHPDVSINDQKYLVHQLGQLWLHGIDVDWNAYHMGQGLRRVSLPTYPFERQHFPIEGIEILAQLRRGINLQAIARVTGPAIGVVAPPWQGAGVTPGATGVNPRPFMTTSYRPPINYFQHRLVRLWEDFLGVRPVGIDDDFFHLGGDSLKAVSFVNRVHREINFPLSLAVIFNCPTVRALSQYIEESGQSEGLSLTATEKREYYVLSPAQQRVYIQQKLAETGIGYNMPHIAILEGTLDRERLAHAFIHLVKRHESLRTSFFTVNGEPVQRVHDDVAFAVEYRGALGKGYTVERVLEEFLVTFELDKPPLLRVTLVQEQYQRHILLVDLHHLVADGTSIGLLIREFTALYGGNESQLPGLRFQYKDFCQWQQRRLALESETGEVEIQRQFWLKELAGELPCLQLPADHPRPGVKVFEGRSVRFELGERQTGLLNTLARESGATLNMVLLALFNILLARITGQDDIIIGSAASGRNHVSLDYIIGMFVNTLVLRNFPQGEKTFREFLAEVRERLLDGLENQDFPFEKLVEQVGWQRDPTRHPLFDVMFHMRPVDYSEFHLPGLTVTPYPYDSRAAKFDLTVEVASRGNEPLVSWFHYNNRLFERETVERFVLIFQSIIDTVIQNPYIKIKNIVIAEEEDLDELVSLSRGQLENE